MDSGVTSSSGVAGNGVVKLNVGGTPFTTTLTVLTSEPDSRFNHPIAGENLKLLQDLLLRREVDTGPTVAFVFWFDEAMPGGDVVAHEEWADCLGLSTFENFKEVFDAVACTDWRKMTSSGEDFGGPWKEPEGSERKRCAGDICFEENARALWRVAAEYTPEAVLYCVRYLCGFRAESVKQVEELCKWASSRM